jgi:hypothetical protein
MSFLTPLFLLGGLAIALPVFFHLIRRTTRERTPFSSLMFLFPTPPRLTQRSRLEHLLLLALRCLVLGLLALGFARPFLKRPVSSDPNANGRRRALLVDASASMHRADLWTDAQDRVKGLVSQAGPADQVAVFTFDRQLHSILSFEEWNRLPVGERASVAARKLAEVPPGWLGTRLDSALIQAAEALADTGGKTGNGPGEIFLISDLEEGDRLDQLQGFEWPRNVQVMIEPLKARHVGNASLQVLTEPEDAAQKRQGLRVRISNTVDSKREQFKVGWAGADGRFAGTPQEIYVPPGQSRVVSIPVPATGPSAERVMLEGDEETFDNLAFAVPTEQARLQVLYFGEESAADVKQPLYFLQRAFQETRQQLVQVVGQSPQSPISAGQLRSASLIVIGEPIPEQLADAVRSEVQAGKTVLYLLRGESAAAGLARVAGVSPFEVRETKPGNYAMLAEIDFRDPLFAPFSDPRFSDFTKIHFWRYRRVEAARFPGARVLAKFDSGDPALLELPLDQGRVLLLTSGWHPEDSQLALSTKFVPLLYSILEKGGATVASAPLYQVSDLVPLRGLQEQGSDSKLLMPDQTEVKLTSGQTNFAGTTLPGVYTVVSSRTTRRFAVNLDPAESRTSPVPVDEFERLGVPLTRSDSRFIPDADARVRLKNAELEDRQKLWRWLILAALSLAIVETAAAGMAARRARAVTVGSATS